MVEKAERGVENIRPELEELLVDALKDLPHEVQRATTRETLLKLPKTVPVFCGRWSKETMSTTVRDELEGVYEKISNLGQEVSQHVASSIRESEEKLMQKMKDMPVECKDAVKDQFKELRGNLLGVGNRAHGKLFGVLGRK